MKCRQGEILSNVIGSGRGRVGTGTPKWKVWLLPMDSLRLSGLGESDCPPRLDHRGWGRERKYQAWGFWFWIPRTFSISILGKAWGQDQLWIHSFLLHTEVLCEYWVLLWRSKNTLQLWSEINCFVERTVYFDRFSVGACEKAVPSRNFLGWCDKADLLMASEAISPSFKERSWCSSFWKSRCSLCSTFSHNSK